MQNKHLGKTKNTGYGKEIPPNKPHVLIWFLQMGSSIAMATDFWRFYESRAWNNDKGVAISDWKMTAWEWLWNRGKKEL